MNNTHERREPFGGRVRVTPEIEDRALVLIEKRGWQLGTVADFLRVHREPLRRALCARFGRVRIGRVT